MIVELWYNANLADRDENAMRGMVWKGTFQTSQAIDPSTDEEWLEMIYAMFNKGSGVEHPAMRAHKLRSLSVSDVVCLRESPAGLNPRFYYCDIIGFRPVEKP